MLLFLREVYKEKCSESIGIISVLAFLHSPIKCLPKTTNDSLLASKSFLPDLAASIVKSIQSKELIADK